jgi:hypothetical protein
MTNDQLAAIVVEGVQKLRHYLPYIRTLKERFNTGDRDSANRLKTPIRDCYSWKEFCKNQFDHTDSAVRKALASPPHPKNDTPCQITDAEFAAIQDGDLSTLLEELTNYKINRIEGDAYAALAETTIQKLKTSRSDQLNATIEKLHHAATILAGLADTLRKVQAA